MSKKWINAYFSALAFLSSLLFASLVLFSLFFIHELGHIIFGLVEGFVRYGVILPFSFSSWIDVGWISIPVTASIGGEVGAFFRLGGPITTITVVLLISWYVYMRVPKMGARIFLIPITVALDEISRNVICGTDNLFGSIPEFCHTLPYNDFTVFLVILPIMWTSYPFIKTGLLKKASRMRHKNKLF